jgi:hypothetical protein
MISANTAPAPAPTTAWKRCTWWCGDDECPAACPNQFAPAAVVDAAPIPAAAPQCPSCDEPIRDVAGYVRLLAYLAAIADGAMTAHQAAALLLGEPPDAAA